MPLLSILLLASLGSSGVLPDPELDWHEERFTERQSAAASTPTTSVGIQRVKLGLTVLALGGSIWGAAAIHGVPLWMTGLQTLAAGSLAIPFVPIFRDKDPVEMALRFLAAVFLLPSASGLTAFAVGEVWHGTARPIRGLIGAGVGALVGVLVAHLLYPSTRSDDVVSRVLAPLVIGTCATLGYQAANGGLRPAPEP
jgi:hypothetical protein